MSTTPPPIITGPGSYVTREGKRVEVERSGPDAFWDQETFPWRIVGTGRPPPSHTFKPSGRVDHYKERPGDIIGPWIDEVRIEPIPRDFRPIPGRHKAVQRDGLVCNISHVSESLGFNCAGPRFPDWSSWHTGAYRNGTEEDSSTDIVAFIDTKPDSTPTPKETPMATSPAPFTSIDQIKVGMLVRVLEEISGGDPQFKPKVGDIVTVRQIDSDGVPVGIGYNGPNPDARPYFTKLHKVAPADESPLAIARAEVARLEAEEAAAKTLASLPEPLRKCHEYLKANPDAFGCQRKHVVAIVEALTGEKLP